MSYSRDFSDDLPQSFGPWTRVWSQFRRWSRTDRFSVVAFHSLQLDPRSWFTVDDTERVTRAIDHVLGLIFKDLAATGVPLPRVEPTTWQTWQPSESVTLFAADGTGIGVWLDLTLSEDRALAHLADQVQEWVVEELARLHRPTSWPICAAHPAKHPRQAVVEHGRAVWACPVGAADSPPIGELPSG